jgi:hypothetical protein
VVTSFQAVGLSCTTLHTTGYPVCCSGEYALR